MVFVRKNIATVEKLLYNNKGSYKLATAFSLMAMVTINDHIQSSISLSLGSTTAFSRIISSSALLCMCPCPTPCPAEGDIVLAIHFYINSKVELFS